MIFGSVCSGIEAASVAWHPLGWRAAFLSDIEAFPRAVLKHHYPETPLHGDFTTIEAGEYEPIDLLVGGTPCQDFSVAGLRAGMAGDRGNLTLQFLTLARRLRPLWLVWENVPGVLSSNGGRDFGAFLGGLGELGYGWAYRTLDAQHLGVPQRRRRVFVVGHLGDWRRAAAVLFERHSLSGNPPPRREAGEGVTSILEAGARTGKSTDDIRAGIGISDPGDPMFTLQAGKQHAVASTGDVSRCLNAGGMGRQDYETETLIAHSLRADGFDASEDGTGRGTPLVPVSFTGGASDCIVERDLAHPVTGRNGDPGMIAFDTTQITSATNRCQPEPGDPCHPLAAGAHPPAIAFSCKDHGADAGDLSPTLRAMGHDDSHANAGGQLAVAFNLRGRDGGAMPETDELASLRAASGGSSRSYVVGSDHGDAEKTRRFEVLRAVRGAIGAEAFAEWQAGIESTLWSPEVLRSEVHGDGVRREADEAGRGLDGGPLSCAPGGPAGALRELREAGCERRPPSGRGLSEQLARELGKALSELSSEGAQSASFLHDLRQAGKGLGLLQPPLHPAQGRALAVRRLTPAECEALQGFPRNYTLVPYRGKPAADGPRYKALGNSMAVPVMRWLGERIEAVRAILAASEAA